MICTTYFANMRNLPKDIIPISICGKAPDWYKGIQYKKLAPKYGIFMEWKQNHDNDFYIEHFQKEVLDTLNINDVITQLYTLSEGKDIALVCYEKPSDFCHRHLVANWIKEVGLLECEEFIKPINNKDKII